MNTYIKFILLSVLIGAGYFIHDAGAACQYIPRSYDPLPDINIGLYGIDSATNKPTGIFLDAGFDGASDFKSGTLAVDYLYWPENSSRPSNYSVNITDTFNQRGWVNCFLPVAMNYGKYDITATANYSYYVNRDASANRMESFSVTRPPQPEPPPPPPPLSGSIRVVGQGSDLAFFDTQENATDISSAAGIRYIQELGVSQRIRDGYGSFEAYGEYVNPDGEIVKEGQEINLYPFSWAPQFDPIYLWDFWDEQTKIEFRLDELNVLNQSPTLLYLTGKGKINVGQRTSNADWGLFYRPADDVFYMTTAIVPEASSLLLLSLGLFGMAWLVYRTRT